MALSVTNITKKLYKQTIFPKNETCCWCDYLIEYKKKRWWILDLYIFSSHSSCSLIFCLLNDKTIQKYSSSATALIPQHVLSFDIKFATSWNGYTFAFHTTTTPLKRNTEPCLAGLHLAGYFPNPTCNFLLPQFQRLHTVILGIL